jgi:hypothetical protein
MQAHPRIHLDLFVDTTAEQQAEVERLVALGGTGLTGTVIPTTRISWHSPIRTATPFAWWT